MGSDDEIDVPGAGAASRPSPASVHLGDVEAAQLRATSAIEGGDAVDIAAELASGRIDAAAATDLLIESVLAEQLPPNSPPAQVEAMRAELRALLAGDPALERLLDTARPTSAGREP